MKNDLEIFSNQLSPYWRNTYDTISHSMVEPSGGRIRFKSLGNGELLVWSFGSNLMRIYDIESFSFKHLLLAPIKIHNLIGSGDSGYYIEHFSRCMNIIDSKFTVSRAMPNATYLDSLSDDRILCVLDGSFSERAFSIVDAMTGEILTKTTLIWSKERFGKVVGTTDCRFTYFIKSLDHWKYNRGYSFNFVYRYDNIQDRTIRFAEHSSPVNDIILVNNDKYIASIDDDCLLKIYRTDTGKQVLSIKHDKTASKEKLLEFGGYIGMSHRSEWLFYSLTDLIDEDDRSPKIIESSYANSNEIIIDADYLYLVSNNGFRIKVIRIDKSLGMVDRYYIDGIETPPVGVLGKELTKSFMIVTESESSLIKIDFDTGKFRRLVIPYYQSNSILRFIESFLVSITWSDYSYHIRLFESDLNAYTSTDIDWKYDILVNDSTFKDWRPLEVQVHFNGEFIYFLITEKKASRSFSASKVRNIHTYKLSKRKIEEIAKIDVDIKPLNYNRLIGNFFITSHFPLPLESNPQYEWREKAWEMKVFSIGQNGEVAKLDYGEGWLKDRHSWIQNVLYGDEDQYLITGKDGAYLTCADQEYHIALTGIVAAKFYSSYMLALTTVDETHEVRGNRYSVYRFNKKTQEVLLVSDLWIEGGRGGGFGGETFHLSDKCIILYRNDAIYLCNFVEDGGKFRRLEHDYPDMHLSSLDEDRMLLVLNRHSKKYVVRLHHSSITHLATFHLGTDGFIWTIPPEEGERGTYFWTNNTDYVHVIEEVNGEKRILQPDDPRRAEHLKIYNSQYHVSTRINNMERYKKLMLANKAPKIETNLTTRFLDSGQDW